MCHTAVRNGVTVSRADNDTAVPRREKYFGLPFLTLDLIRALIRKRDSDKDDEVYGFDAQSDRDFLARSVQYVFSNKIALCSSFLRSPGSVDFKKNSDIDYKSLDKAYKIMNSLTPHLMFRDEIVAKLEQLLIEDIFNLDATNTCDCRYMRKYIVILENDHIWESSCALRFGRFISRIISYMDQQRKDTLSEWLARTNKDRLEKYVKIFNKCITNEFQPNSADPLLFIADYLQVLKLLYNSNQCRKKFCSAKSSSDVVPMSSFYNTAVSEGLNYKRQYKLIMSSKENEGSRPRNSILDYTFLLNPLGKTRLMRVGAVFEMLNKYGSAFMNIEIVNHTCRLFENQFFSLDIPTGLSSEITPFLVLEVRRDNIVDETIRQIHKKMNSLKKPLKVRFIDSGEMGVDQGGIQKEFFQIVVDKFLNPVYGMFAYDEETRLSWIDGSSKERSSTFEAFGIIQGLALYNGAILRLNFPSAIYKKLLDDDLDLEDLKSVFPSMGNSLQELLDYEHDDIEDVFLLDFTVSHESFGVINTVPLIKDGENIQVNKENRREFVSLVVKDVLVKRCRRQFEAYKSGFYKVLDKNLVKISSYDELELMICGREPASIDFVQLKDSTTYTNGYTSESPVIKWFWTLLLEEFTPEQRMAFLTFCTASNRMPLGGLKMLKFTISKNSSSTYRLPAAMTCFSTLMLPEYDSIDKLKHSLLTAIQCSSGFGLV